MTQYPRRRSDLGGTVGFLTHEIEVSCNIILEGKMKSLLC